MASLAQGEKPATKARVLVGMSGGVDSAVSALLLKRAGFNVVGAFIKNWEPIGPQEGECTWVTERREAIRAAAIIGVPLLTLDFEKEYRREVIENFYAEYQKGRTPNPDVLCNRQIKFGLLMETAGALGISQIATGHYAQIKDGAIWRGADQNKDQSYFLWGVKPALLGQIVFPVGRFRKEAVRKIAAAAGLPQADKKDSQGICFIGKINLQDFLGQKIRRRRGKIIDPNGQLVGEHQGSWAFTIGQRHGLALGQREGVKKEAFYVIGIDSAKNLVIVGPEHLLYHRALVASDANWHAKEVAEALRAGKKVALEAAIRYRERAGKCDVTLKGKRLYVTFREPRRAITPGQSIVFYAGARLLGGATIEGLK